MTEVPVLGPQDESRVHPESHRAGPHPFSRSNGCAGATGCALETALCLFRDLETSLMEGEAEAVGRDELPRLVLDVKLPDVRWPVAGPHRLHVGPITEELGPVQSAPTIKIAGQKLIRDRQAGEPVADVAQLVFHRATQEGFQPWRLDVTTHTFQRYAKAAGVPVTPFHHLRHACASWLLADGKDVVAVSERLGHWSPAITLTIYSHAIKGRQKVLAASMDAALG